MPRSPDELTLIEQQVLLAVLRLHPNGYGNSIQTEIETRTGRAPAFGSLYAVFERLVKRGFLDARDGEATAVRGGRRKTYLTISAPGRKALSESLRSIDAMRSGIQGIGEMA